MEFHLLSFILNFSIVDRLDGVRLLWSLLKSPNPEVSALCIFPFTYKYLSISTFVLMLA